VNGAYVLIGEAAAVVVAAPLAGVALAGSRLRGLRWALIALALLGGLSVSWTMLMARLPWQTAVEVHLTLGAATLALSALGIWCGSAFRDPLDAAAWSLAVPLIATCGLLSLGSFSADLPTPIVNAALLANPIVAVASAANIDLLRFEFLYQVSPIVHRTFDYPTWYAAVACFSVAALIAATGAAHARRFEGVR
jgi:hypothetical protein